MAMPLAYISLFATDLDRLARFYVDGLGLVEQEALRTPIFRSLDLGNGTMLALHGAEAYALLGLEARAAASGVRTMLTFDPGSAPAVDEHVEVLTGLGATLVKGPFVTAYHARQAVLADPDGHVVRLSHQIEP
jgi:catechol 2,3-dioxygenase-like lactoylglutathione lyase family enzyme